MESHGETTVYEGEPPWPPPYDGMIWPVKGRATSEFGWRGGRLHKGLDIAADAGTPIVAAQAGRVVFCGWQGGYGQTIDIDHGGGLVTRHAHQSLTLVSEGDLVARGQRIGRVGTTGSSTGPHLHFEVRVDDGPRDPRTALSPARRHIAPDDRPEPHGT
jgi:murein DD-endopeptidase MepM/ murein hydrolase activator NlpD